MKNQSFYIALYLGILSNSLPSQTSKLYQIIMCKHNTKCNGKVYSCQRHKWCLICDCGVSINPDNSNTSSNTQQRRGTRPRVGGPPRAPSTSTSTTYVPSGTAVVSAPAGTIPVVPGYATVPYCTYCQKAGHTLSACWSKPQSRSAVLVVGTAPPSSSTLNPPALQVLASSGSAIYTGATATYSSIGGFGGAAAVIRTSTRRRYNGSWNCPDCGKYGITSDYCPDCGSAGPNA